MLKTRQAVLGSIYLALAAAFLFAVPQVRAATIAPIYTFTNTLPGGVDGATPTGGLIQASNGVLYGTTLNGGSNNGYGTIFTVTTNGAFTPLYTFNGLTTDGSTPYAGLVQGTNGNFYGTCYGGGTNAYGSIYRLSSSGAFTELYGFNRLRGAAYTNAEGANPTAALVQGTNGNFYGSAPAGGTNGSGAIFEITPTGTLTKLHIFTNGPDGANPGALFQSSNGFIYGTSTNGGSNGFGTLFKITSAGALTPLYSFTNGTDGAHPGPALVQGTNGILYGTCGGGGSNNSGTIFQITTNGVFTPLYSFAPSGVAGLGLATNADGLNPGALVAAGNNAFYGFTEFGGLNGTGTIFQFSPSSGLTTLYTFLVGAIGGNYTITNTPGAEPTGLLLETNGTLYGTAKTGGANSYGTIFQLGLPPQITGNPTNVYLAFGSTATFTLIASVTSCQWQFNATNIPGATNLVLTLLNVQPANTGPYQAIVSNSFGSVTSVVATLNITNILTSFASNPADLQYSAGQFTLTLTSLTGQGAIIIDSSSDLRTWTPLATNPPSYGRLPFTDPVATGPNRFYRARIVPGP